MRCLSWPAAALRFGQHEHKKKLFATLLRSKQKCTLDNLNLNSGEMLIQSLLPSSIEASFSFVSELREQDVLFDQMPGAETWQMCSKCDLHIDCHCIRTVTIMEDKQNAGCSCSLSHMGSSSEIPAVNTASRSATIGLVYKRRKLQKSPGCAPATDVFGNTASRNINLVYQRRKLQNDPVSVLSEQVSPSMLARAKLSGACISVVRSENPLPVVTDKHAVSEALCETEPVRSSMSAENCNEDKVLTNSDTVDACLAEEHGIDAKDKMGRIPEFYSVDDSCSSSMLNMDLGSASLRNELDSSGEYSSSGALKEALGEDLSEKDLCISILRSHGLLSGCWQNGTYPSMEDVPSCSGRGSSLTCDVCSHLETTKNMLICDHCEKAFHVSCCNPFVKKIPLDEWYCQSCCKKKHIIMKQTKIKKSSIIKSEVGSRNTISKDELGPIALMLKDTEPYTTGVRIGKAFQADVPDWSGPVAMDSDAIAEPLELDLSEIFSLPEFSSSKPPRSNSIGNWLQCREVIVGLGEARDGTICGKWRRAPLFEVQTDDWDCFQSFLWDPTHADCAVPQELETDQVLKQLKYIEMLRPRLAAERRKMVSAGVDGCLDPADDGGNCTDCTKAEGNT